jgi:hypothetical protein
MDHRKHPGSNSNSTVACVFIVVGMCLLSCCPEKIVVYSHRLATGLYATIFFNCIVYIMLNGMKRATKNKQDGWLLDRKSNLKSFENE